MPLPTEPHGHPALAHPALAHPALARTGPPGTGPLTALAHLRHWAVHPVNALRGTGPHRREISLQGCKRLDKRWQRVSGSAAAVLRDAGRSSQTGANECSGHGGAAKQLLVLQSLPMPTSASGDAADACGGAWPPPPLPVDVDARGAGASGGAVHGWAAG